MTGPKVIFPALLITATLATRALCALPALEAPPEPVVKVVRDLDVEWMRDWYYKCTRIPSVQAVIRLKAWSDAHPEDGEALFYVWACYKFNLMYREIEWSRVDEGDLAVVIKRSAELGFVPARARYALMLMRSPEVERSAEAVDPQAGMKMLEECIARQDADAHMYKGLLIALGESGLRGGPAEAKRYLELAVKLGKVGAWVYLAEIEFRNNQPEAAERSLRQGAAAGDPLAQCKLAGYLSKSAESKKELEEVFRWARESCQHQKCLPEAHKLLADCYYKGRGTEEDHAEALHWYKVAASLGDFDSGYQLASQWLTADGCRMNVQGALKAMDELVQAHYGRAQMFMGTACLEGLLVPRDLKRAEKYFELADENGEDGAWVYLRMMKPDTGEFEGQ